MAKRFTTGQKTPTNYRQDTTRLYIECYQSIYNGILPDANAETEPEGREVNSLPILGSSEIGKFQPRESGEKQGKKL